MPSFKGMTCKLPLILWFVIFPILTTYAEFEAPFFTTPQFSDVTHRTNLCSKYDEYVKSGSTEISELLKGLKLSVGIVDQPNDFFFNLNRNNMSINDDDDKGPGIFVVILDELAKRAGFTWRDSFGIISPPENRDDDGSWTDVLVDSVKMYDLSFAEWVHTNDRRAKGVYFPLGWYDTSTIIIQDRGVTNEFKIGSWTRPLDFTLWLLFALGFIYNRTLYWILDKIEEEGEEREITSKEKCFRIRMVELVFDSDRSNAKRLHNMSASLFAMVFVSSLTANLAIFLIQQSEPDFQYVGLEDLDARSIEVCVRPNGAVYESLSDDFESMNFIRKVDDASSGDAILDNFQNLLAGHCEVLATRRADFDVYERNLTANPDCALEWVGRPEYINFGGMATFVDMDTRCTSLVGHILDFWMHDISDFIDEAWELHLRNISSSFKCPPKVVKKDSRYSLTLNDIGGIFIVYGCLAFVGLFVAMIEQYYERKRKANEAANDLYLNEHSEDGGTHVNMTGEVVRGGGSSQARPIRIDADVLKRILAIDHTISKLKYECGGEKRPSRRQSPGGSFRGFSGSFRKRSDSNKSLGGSSREGGTPSPRNSGSPAGGRPRQRPSLSELGKPKSHQNILAMG